MVKYKPGYLTVSVTHLIKHLITRVGWQFLWIDLIFLRRLISKKYFSQGPCSAKSRAFWNIPFPKYFPNTIFLFTWPTMRKTLRTMFAIFSCLDTFFSQKSESIYFSVFKIAHEINMNNTDCVRYLLKHQINDSLLDITTNTGS